MPADTPSRNAPPSPFSPARIWTLATNTFTQLVRMRVFYFLLIFALVVIGVARVYLSWSQEQELKLIKDVGFGAMRVFADLFAIAATALLIPKDIEDRTLYTILSKPVSRIEYLAGKLLGVILLIGISLILMQAIFGSVLHFRQQAILSDAMHQLDTNPPFYVETAEDLQKLKDDTSQSILAQGINLNLLAATLSLFVKASVLASFTLLISTFASSTLFTIMCGVAAYIIGHSQGLARDYFLAGTFTEGFEHVVAFVVAILFPDLESLSLVDGIVTGQVVPAAVVFKILGIGFLYVLIYNLAAFFVFSDKEL